MSVQLKIDEMLEVLKEINHPLADQFIVMVEATGSAMARVLAAHLGVVAGDATFEGVGFAGTCVPFEPAYRGQPCPDVLEQFDPNEWDSDDPDLPDAPEGV